MMVALWSAVGLVVTLIVVRLAGLLARATRQPAVIGEMVVGLFAVPALLTVAPAPVRAVASQVHPVVSLFGHAGLILLLVTVARELSGGVSGGRALGGLRKVVFGGFGLPLVVAVGLGLWLELSGPAGWRGHGSAAGDVVFIAVAGAVTAVPVLARILADRGIIGTQLGRSVLTCAVSMDVTGWVLLALALALAKGTGSGMLATLAVLAAGLAVCVLLRRMGKRWSTESWPRGRTSTVLAAVVVGAVAIVAGRLVALTGISEVFGALIIGLALPAGANWDRVVRYIGVVGRPLMGVYFVVTGMTMMGGLSGAIPLTLLVVGLLVTAKVVGGYFGARAAGWSPADRWRAGVLLNARGLTELVVLQVGLDAGLVSISTVFAFAMLAVISTVLAAPGLELIRYREKRTITAPLPMSIAT